MPAINQMNIAAIKYGSLPATPAYSRGKEQLFYAAAGICAVYFGLLILTDSHDAFSISNKIDFMGRGILGMRYSTACFFFVFLFLTSSSLKTSAQTSVNTPEAILMRLKEAEVVNIGLPDHYKFSYFAKSDSADYKNKYIFTTASYAAIAVPNTDFSVDVFSPLREVYDTITCNTNSDTFRYSENRLLGFQRHNMVFDLCKFDYYTINSTNSSYTYTFYQDSIVVLEDTRLSVASYRKRKGNYDSVKNIKKGDISRYQFAGTENTIKRIRFVYDCDSLLVLS